VSNMVSNMDVCNFHMGRIYLPIVVSYGKVVVCRVVYQETF
jgi:hypothetical protein